MKLKELGVIRIRRRDCGEGLFEVVTNPQPNA
jgi:hypothetical protein